MDKNLISIINLLNKYKIFYWIGHGTLLGVIREKKLIEWDHDIDICLWFHQNSKKKIIKILKQDGFTYRSDLTFGETFDLMSFDRIGGRRVDINFYQKKVLPDGSLIAYTKWGYPKNIFMSIIDAISLADKYNSSYKFIINKLKIFQSTALNLKNYLIKKKLFYKSAGYKQPINFLKKFKKINFNGLKVRIPYDSMGYLEFIYGSNWKIRQKKFSWWKLKNLNYDY